MLFWKCLFLGKEIKLVFQTKEIVDYGNQKRGNCGQGGAIGLLYGSMIAQHLGENAIQFVMDDDRFARHSGEQVSVNGAPCGISTIPETQARPVDLVIVAVKATGLERALDTLEHLVDPQTKIVSLLNGVTSEERIAQRFGWERTVISVAQGMDAVFIDNKLTYAHTGEIRFGAALDTDPEVVEELDDFYTQAGISHVVEKDIQHRLWVKFMLNVGVNQTCMAYGGTYGSASEQGSEQNRCFVAAMREALSVARAEGIQVSEEDLTQMANLAASLDPQGLPSMAQDRVNKKRSEVEEFAGVVIRLAGKHHILVPQNRWLYDQIHAIEAGYCSD